MRALGWAGPWHGPDSAPDQAEDRVHRIGQANPCTIKYLLATDGTSDELLWPMLNSKLAVVGASLDGGKLGPDGT